MEDILSGKSVGTRNEIGEVTIEDVIGSLTKTEKKGIYDTMIARLGDEVPKELLSLGEAIKPNDGANPITSDNHEVRENREENDKDINGPLYILQALKDDRGDGSIFYDQEIDLALSDEIDSNMYMRSDRVIIRSIKRKPPILEIDGRDVTMKPQRILE